MPQPYVGEIRLFPAGFAPLGWVVCDGRQLPISGYQALFSILGTVYGGNGTTTFGIPDLRGRVPIHPSATIPLGTLGGEQAHQLAVLEMPQHTHQAWGSSDEAAVSSPEGSLWAQAAAPYAPASSPKAMNPGAISPMGGGQAHFNMQPYLALTFCMAYQGVYPPHNEEGA